MSQENVEIVRRIYDQEMFGPDPDRLLDLAMPDIERQSPYAIEPGVRRGRAGVAEAVKNAHQFATRPATSSTSCSKSMSS